jgi:hypothetical protein
MEQVARLVGGPLVPFEKWATAQIPQVAAGVYTIWDSATFIYVGMAGRGLSSEALRLRAKSTGLSTRLASHASGRRSGDQFCVYVCDRLVLPELTREQVLEVAAGRLSLDGLTRDYIRGRLGFRWTVTEDGPAAHALERSFRRGETTAGLPMLNPEVTPVER